MWSILFLLVFIYIFWFVHIVRRIFEHTYLWQIKEYRWDRIIAHFKETKLFSSKNVTTIISAIFAVFGVLLSRCMECKLLYLVLLFAFAYYVYSTLTTFTKLISKKLTRPGKRMRNLFIVGMSIALSLIPLVLTYTFFDSLYQSAAAGLESAEFLQVFPKEEEGGLVVIPLETATIVLFFLYLFAFDLAIPLIVSVLATLTLPLASLVRKKK